MVASNSGGGFLSHLMDPEKAPLVLGLLSGLSGLGAGMSRGQGAAGPMTFQGIQGGMQMGQGMMDAQRQAMMTQALRGDPATLTPQQLAIRNSIPEELRSMAPILGQQGLQQAAVRMAGREPTVTWQPLPPERVQAMGLPANSSWQVSSRGEVKPAYQAPEILDPAVQEARMRIAAAGRSTTQVNNNIAAPQMERAFGTEYGRALGTEATGIVQNAGRAQNQLNLLSQFERLQAATPTGPGTQTMTTWAGLAERAGVPASVLSSLGVDPAATANAQAMESINNRLTLEAAGGGLGAQVSNSDREFLQNIYPSLSGTPEANRLKIQINRNLAQRNIEAANSLRQHLATRGTTAEAMNEWQLQVAPRLAERPIVPAEAVQTLRGQGGAPANSPAAALPAARSLLEGAMPPAGASGGAAPTRAPPPSRPTRQPEAGQIPQISTPQEAAALPPGTVFLDPRGVRRVVPAR